MKRRKKYRLNIENLVEIYQQQGNINDLKTKVEHQYEELKKLI